MTILLSLEKRYKYTVQEHNDLQSTLHPLDTDKCEENYISPSTCAISLYMSQ